MPHSRLWCKTPSQDLEMERVMDLLMVIKTEIRMAIETGLSLAKDWGFHWERWMAKMKLRLLMVKQRD